eukprot:5316463-Alexandrium_andersonii.AAC.1
MLLDARACLWRCARGCLSQLSGRVKPGVCWHACAPPSPACNVWALAVQADTRGDACVGEGCGVGPSF